MSSSGVVLTSDRAISYSAIEDALHGQGILDGYLIHIEPHRDQLMISIQVSVPTAWITAAGVPELPAAQVLHSLTAAVQEIDRVTEE